MEKFVYFFHEEGVLKKLSPQQMQDYLQKWLDWIKVVKDNDAYILGEPIEPTGKQISGKNKIISDSSFTKENNINGFIFIKATDLENAISLAMGCPIYQVDGKIEVRQIRKIAF